MIRASATRCRCGREFDPATIVKRAARRCPLCGALEDGGAAACDCGYDFSTPAADVRRQLVRRKRFGWFWIASGVLCVGVAGGVWFFAISTALGAGVAVGGSWLIARGIRAISWTRGELAEIDARDRALPRARVVE